MKIVAYLSETGSSSISMRDQRSLVEQFTQRHQHVLIGSVEDTVRGKLAERPGWSQALELLRSGAAEALVTARLDCLTRTLSELAALIELYFGDGSGPFGFISVKDQIDNRTEAGRLALATLITIGRWNRDEIADRTVETMRGMKLERRAYSRPVYGWDREGDKLVENAAELAIVQRMIAMRADGVSFQKIADKLNREGVPTKRGGVWRASTVRGIVIACDSMPINFLCP